MQPVQESKSGGITQPSGPAPGTDTAGPSLAKRLLPTAAAIAVAVIAYFAPVGGGVVDLAIGACAAVYASVALFRARENEHSAALAALASLLTPLAFVATIYFGIGTWVLASGFQAPPTGFITEYPLRVFTVIESPDDPLRHEARFEQRIPAEVGSVRIDIAASNDPRVREVELKPLGRGPAPDEVPRESPLRAGIYFAQVRPGPLELMVIARVREPVPATKPVSVLLFVEHGKRDMHWRVIDWFRSRYTR